MDPELPRPARRSPPAAAGRAVRPPARSRGLAARLGLAVSSAAEPAEAARAFLAELAGALSIEAWLACWDAARAEPFWLPGDAPGPVPLALVRSDGSLIGAAVREARASRVDDLEAAAAFPERRHLRRRGGSWRFLPVASGGRALGCLLLRAPKPASLPDEAVEEVLPALPLVGLHLRLALMQRDLETRVDERTEEIALLYETSRSLAFVAEPGDLFRLLAAALRRALPFDLCSFLLLLPDRRQLAVHLAAPADDRAVRKLARLAFEEARRLLGSAPGRVPVSTERLAPEAGEPAIGPADLRSAAHAPLQLRGRTVGLVSVASRQAGAFGEARMRLLSTIAAQAALTLDRLRSVQEAESHRVHSMLESMAEGIVLLDRGLRPVMVNPAARAGLAALTGRRAPRAIARLGGVDLRALLEDMERPEAPARTFEAVAVDGGRIFSITCSPVRGPEGRLEGLAVVVSDVTESRALQIQLAQSERLSALGEMISGVAHELNNPLASVMAHAELLQGRPLGEDALRKLAAIASEARRCQRIVQSLLRFARPHAPERRSVDLNEAVASVLQLLGRQLQVDDVAVELDLAQPLRPVMGDLHLLQQVVLNIVFNAYQALKQRGGPGRLTVSTRNRDGMVAVTISDDGPGIAQKHLNRIFDPFFTTKEVGKGTGLGLSLAYTTVRDHDGTIVARSRPGAGATFVIELPAAGGAGEAPPPAPREAEGRPGGPDAAPERPPGAGPAAGARILVVEDEAALAEVMAEALQARGHRVETVGDGRTARARVAAGDYDLIISDMKMPHMNGREFFRHVAGSRPALARRVIFSTGDTANPETQAFFEEAGVPVLAKPFSLAELMRVVDAVLSRG